MRRSDSIKRGLWPSLEPVPILVSVPRSAAISQCLVSRSAVVGSAVFSELRPRHAGCAVVVPVAAAGQTRQQLSLESSDKARGNSQVAAILSRGLKHINPCTSSTHPISRLGSLCRAPSFRSLGALSASPSPSVPPSLRPPVPQSLRPSRSPSLLLSHSPRRKRSEEGMCRKSGRVGCRREDTYQ